ncbi:Pre-rRNA-processing protein ipi3 [Tulasnella sp. 331]|nr:Pre-rRNA-processing protein ipi3 [Tulasnella sp. 331]
MAIESSGRYFAGGTPTGRIYLWEMSSGILFSTFEAHYRRVNVLRFTTDGIALISGSEDSGVSVWVMAHLLDNDKQHEMPTPYCSLADHTLPITDIACGLWDMGTRTLLITFLFPRPINVVALDPAERVLFAASPDGFIHQVNLFRERHDRASKSTGAIEALSGFGPDDATRIDDNEQGFQLKRLINIEHEILSMTLSMTGSILLIGTATGQVHIYDVASHQLLKTVNTHQGFRATHLSTFIKPSDLTGHVTIGSASHLDTIPLYPITSFHRIRDATARTAHEIVPDTLPPYNLEIDHDCLITQSSTGVSGQALQARVAGLEAEVENLTQNLSKAIGLNDSMWESVVSTVLGSDEALENGLPHSAKRSKARS